MDVTSEPMDEVFQETVTQPSQPEIVPANEPVIDAKACMRLTTKCNDMMKGIYSILLLNDNVQVGEYVAEKLAELSAYVNTNVQKGKLHKELLSKDLRHKNIQPKWRKVPLFKKKRLEKTKSPLKVRVVNRKDEIKKRKVDRREAKREKEARECAAAERTADPPGGYGRDLFDKVVKIRERASRVIILDHREYTEYSNRDKCKYN